MQEVCVRRSNLSSCVDDGASVQQLGDDVDVTLFRRQMQRVQTVLQTQTNSAVIVFIIITVTFRRPGFDLTVSGQVKAHVVLTCTNRVSTLESPITSL